MKLRNGLILSAVTLTAAALILTGCSSTTSTTTSSSAASTASPGTSSSDSAKPSGSGKASGSNPLVTAYESALKDLVSVGTITQDQSDKILAAVQSAANDKTANGQGAQPSGQPGGQQGAQPGGQQGGQQGAQPSGQPKGQPGGQTNDGKEILSSLVTSGVITQSQADAIESAVTSAMQLQQSGNSAASTESPKTQTSPAATQN